MFPHNSTWNTNGRLSQRMVHRVPSNWRQSRKREISRDVSILRTGFSKVKSNRDVPTMANEEWTKRFLRLACYSPKDTREPRGPEHMAKMKVARGPYSDPRDTYIARTIRHAFESSRGEPLSTGQLVKEIFGWQLRVERKPLKSWHYQNVRRALRKVASPIGRASTRGRSVLWQPDERMGLRDRARHKLARARKLRPTI